MKAITLGNKIDKIKALDPERVISLKTKQYGVFWTGKVKFAFSHLSYAAWNSTDDSIEIV